MTVRGATARPAAQRSASDHAATFDVLAVELPPIYSEPAYLADGELEILSGCPVCGEAAHQATIASSEADDAVGLAIAWCGSCDHVYLSRRPSAEWYQAYYAGDWDTGRLNMLGRGATGSLRRLVMRNAGVSRAVRGLRSVAAGRMAPYEPLRVMLAGLDGPSRPILTPGSRVLEIGCGYGAALSGFRDLGFEVTGTEANRYRVEVCRDQGLNVRITPIDDLSAVAVHGPFDLVYSAHVFEHLSDLHRMVDNVTPLLRDGGLVYLEVPNGVVAEQLIHRAHVPVHCHMFSGRSLASLLAQHGYGLVRCRLDVNLHLVARKGAPAALPLPGPVGHADYRRGLDPAAAHGDTVRLGYDAMNLEVDDAATGRSLYRRPVPFVAERVTGDHDVVLVNRFTIRGTGAGVLPDQHVRFRHAGARPPVFLKRQ